MEKGEARAESPIPMVYQYSNTIFVESSLCHFDKNPQLEFFFLITGIGLYSIVAHWFILNSKRCKIILEITGSNFFPYLVKFYRIFALNRILLDFTSIFHLFDFK